MIAVKPVVETSNVVKCCTAGLRVAEWSGFAIVGELPGEAPVSDTTQFDGKLRLDQPALGAHLLLNGKGISPMG